MAEVSGKAIPEHFSAYVVIPSNIYFDRDIKPRAKMLYGLISCMSNERGYAFPRNETLQRYLGGVSEDTVGRTLKELVNAGAIVVEDGDGGSPKNIRKIYLANLYPDSLRKMRRLPPAKMRRPHNIRIIKERIILQRRRRRRFANGYPSGHPIWAIPWS